MQLGKYKHFKGGIYKVLGVATHTESEEPLVIYTSEEGRLFARPYALFMGDKDGIKRFVYMGDE